MPCFPQVKFSLLWKANKAPLCDMKPENSSGGAASLHLSGHIDSAARLEKQLQKLRATVARRRTIPGSCGETDNVPGILKHYERIIVDLEERICAIHKQSVRDESDQETCNTSIP